MKSHKYKKFILSAALIVFLFFAMTVNIQKISAAGLESTNSVTIRDSINNQQEQSPVGTVVMIDGDIYAQKGSINFTRPIAGDEIKVNEFGQYKDLPPKNNSEIHFIPNTRRHLKPNDHVFENEIIQSDTNSRIKILFKDNSIVDIGKDSMLLIQGFQSQNKKVYMKAPYGKFAVILVNDLKSPDQYQILTPAALIGTKSGQFQFHAKKTTSTPETEILCVHGLVSLDVGRFNQKGIVYYQPIVLRAGMYFLTNGRHSLSQKAEIKPLPQEEVRKLISVIGPQVNTFASSVGSLVQADHLPGTATRLKHEGEPTLNVPRLMSDVQRFQQKKMRSLFDQEHLEEYKTTRAIASDPDTRSENFSPPKDFELQSNNHFLPNSKNIKDEIFLGPAPTNLLPGNTSFIKVNIGL